MQQLPPAPPERRGSFWDLGGPRRDRWDIGVKLLVWGAVFAAVGIWIVTSLAAD